jgi:NADPH:quinone reductase-like Zn-dependent oxidoreductase
MRRELICLEPSAPPRLQVRERSAPRPGRGEVLVRLEATSVNPIDAKRAAGYGRRLFALKGAGRFPIVLGNDLVGRIEAVGPNVPEFTAGQRVFGLVAPGKAGAHASLVTVPRTLLQPAADDTDAAALAVLPYSFTTMWLAVRSIGLAPSNASGRKVLIHGAAGALGRLALQWLSGWGCHITAICGPGTGDECRSLGASEVRERGPRVIRSLSADFDAILNFASWDDEVELVSHLKSNALGQATTVHPLLGHFDRLGWLHGALASRRDKRQIQSAVRARAAAGRYAWTIFRPEPQALAALESAVRARRLSLPIGPCVDLDEADLAFAHVAAGRPGRAVLRP